MASPPLSNDFDGGTDTNTIATSDTGSGDQWNTVDSTPTYSSDHYFTTLSMENSIGGTFARNGVRWTGLGSLTASVYSRMYLWIDATPGVGYQPTQYRTGAAAACAGVELTSGRYFRTLNAAAGTIATGAIQPPTGEWVRIEFRVLPSTTIGETELRWYSSVSPGDGYNGTTPTETLSNTGQVLGANIGEVRYGMTGTTGPTSWTQWIDECAVATSGWIGPITTPAVGREYKRFVGPAQLTGSAADLYTCPASTVARVLGIHASNPSGSPVDINLSIGADAAGTRIYDDFEIPADSVETNFDPYELAAGEKIQGWASTAGTVVVTVSGYEDPV